MRPTSSLLQRGAKFSREICTGQPPLVPAPPLFQEMMYPTEVIWHASDLFYICLDRTSLRLHKEHASKKHLGSLLSSVGRAGVPCTEALSSLQMPQVWAPALDLLLHVTPPLSHPVSCHIIFPVLSIKKQILKKNKNKKNWKHLRKPALLYFLATRRQHSEL